MDTLTTKNMLTTFTIINKKYPEWGTWEFWPNFSGDNLHKIKANNGQGSKILHEDEFHFWSVV